MTGRLDAVLPLDEEVLLDQADPLTRAGGVALKPAAIEARQEAQVRTLLKAGTFAL